MDAEVGDEHAGAHVHRRALVEQRLAEAQRLDLDHVVAGLGERQPDHLERPRIAAGELRQLEPPGAGVVAEERDLARPDPALDPALDRPAPGVDVVLGREPLALRQAELLGRQLRLVVLLQLRVPGEDVGVGLQALDPHLAGARRRRCRCARRRAGRAAQFGLHVPQRHRQHTVGVTLDDAERRRRELRDRRCRAGGDLERKARRVGERPAGVVLQLARQDDAVGRVLRQRPGKDDLGQLARLVVLVEHRRQRIAARRREPHLRRQRARHRRGEAQAHRPDRQAGRGRLLALAAELGRECGAHAQAKALLDRRHHLRVRDGGDALAPDQAQRRAVGERPLAAGDQQPRPLGRTDSARLQELRPLFAADKHQRQLLADAFDLASGMGPHARLDRGAVQADQEMLVFLDLGAVAGLHRDDRRAAGREAELARTGERRRRGRAAGRGRRPPSGTQLGHALRAGRQRLAKVVEPDPVAGPAAGAGRRRALAAQDERIGETRIAEGDDRFGELDRDLADLGDLALRADGDDGGGVRGRHESQAEAEAQGDVARSHSADPPSGIAPV